MFDFFKKEKKENNTTTITNTKYYDTVPLKQRNELYAKEEQLNKKYQKLINEHRANEEHIGMLYTMAINQENIDNKYTKQCIELCIKDIDLADDYKIYKEQLNKIQEQLFGNAFGENYYSFKYLAQLYEKKHEFEKGIEVCKKAIDLGFLSDGTTGGIPGRMARLEKKKRNQDKKAQ